MKNQFFFILKYILPVVVVAPALFSIVEQTSFESKGVLFAGFKDPTKGKDIYSTFEEEPESNFPTNPFELINVMQRIESMKDATSPSDAVEDALKAFENEDNRDSSFDADIQ